MSMPEGIPDDFDSDRVDDDLPDPELRDDYESTTVVEYLPAVGEEARLESEFQALEAGATGEPVVKPQTLAGFNSRTGLGRIFSALTEALERFHLAGQRMEANHPV